MERVIDKSANKTVYGVVEGTLVLREVSGGETVEYHHIGMVLRDEGHITTTDSPG